MTQDKLATHHKWIKEELECCISFWLSNGMDPENGGVYTCLDRHGKLYSTDKSVWMQGRCAWTFAYLCKCYGTQKPWLDAAKSCLDFMQEHCINRDKGNRMYFTVTAKGEPLRQRRYCFSEAFYAIANAQYGAITNDETCLQRGRDAYELIWQLNQHLIEDPVGIPPKTIPKTRACRSLADPMIYLNVSIVMARCDPKNSALYMQRAKESISEILCYHYKPDLGCTLETVGLNGEVLRDITVGRVVNPGHVIECSWFLMDYAAETKDEKLFQTACHMLEDALDIGWDKEYGGLLYYVDCLGLPTEAYEHDMKLWWPHNEALIATLMAYQRSGNEKYLQWFEKTLAYCKHTFSDAEHGEWYGYLRRDGKPTMPPTKGSTFKGPFHLPRMLMMVDQMLAKHI